MDGKDTAAPAGGAGSFEHWEGIIRDHEADFWKVGEALINIKVNELWKEEHSGRAYKSWEDYIEKAWGYVSRARRLMQAAKLHSKLAEAGMSDDEFRMIASNELQAKRLSRAVSLSKKDAAKFVKSVAKKGGKADFDSAARSLDRIRPPRTKPSPAELPDGERMQALEAALERAKSAFEARIEAVSDEFGEPAAIDDWLREFARELLERLDK